MIPQHSHQSVEHYGPPWIGDMVRRIFGADIDLDPASCEQANGLVHAVQYYSERGLERPWFGNVYLNPPGGRVQYGGRMVNQAALWYATLAHRFSLNAVDQAVFMVFNLELLRYAQRWEVRQPLEFAVCIPEDRIDFWKPGPDSRPVSQGAPAHPSLIVYMGPHTDRFAEVFGTLGRVFL